LETRGFVGTEGEKCQSKNLAGKGRRVSWGGGALREKKSGRPPGSGTFGSGRTY